MHAPAILFFSVAAAIACLIVRKAYILQTTYRLPYLHSYAFFLASWNALALFSIFQFILAVEFLPGASWLPLSLATSPLFITIMAVSLYLLSAFLSELSGGSLTKLYKVLFIVIWGGMATGIPLVAGQLQSAPASQAQIPSILLYLFKSATVYGWILTAMLRLSKAEDPSKRRSLRIFVMLFLAGYLFFDLCLRIPLPAALSPFDDYLIAALQIAFPCPSLIYLGYFLRRLALDRPFQKPRTDLKTVLAPFGVSSRETEIVELILKGFSHKEIADKLCISVDTVKKHSYNSYKKLGVQNRVQLSYFLQNLGAQPSGETAGTEAPKGT